jgi:hypothetical protein
MEALRFGHAGNTELDIIEAVVDMRFSGQLWRSRKVLPSTSVRTLPVQHWLVERFSGPGAQRLAVDKRHHVKEETICRPLIEQREDVRMP